MAAQAKTGGIHGKKCQATIFIILGLVILVTFSLGFLAYSQSQKGIRDGQYLAGSLAEDRRTLQQFGSYALYQALDDGIRHIGLHGGCFEPDDYAIRDAGPYPVRVAYGLKGGENLLREKNLTEELGTAFIRYFGYIFEYPPVFGKTSIDYGSAYAETYLSDKEAAVDASIPIRLEHDEASYLADRFNAQLNTDIRVVYSRLSGLIDSIILSPGQYDLSDDDFSCERIVICLEEDSFLKATSFNRYGDEPRLYFQVAVDSSKSIVPGSCTGFDRFNKGDC